MSVLPMSHAHIPSQNTAVVKQFAYFFERGGDRIPWEQWHISVRGYWKEPLGLKIVLGYFRGTFMKVVPGVGTLK